MRLLLERGARGLALLAAALLAPAAGAGERLEIAGYAGYTFPFYSQSFRYDPGQVTVPIPGVSVEQSGEFEANASGGPAFAGGITLYATSGLGFEFRYDRADITVDTRGASYAVRVGLPSPLDPVVANLSLTEGEVDLKAVAPLSFNLKLRTGGSVRFTTSFGASKLGDLEMTLTQSVGLGVIGFDLPGNSVQIGTISLQAKAGPARHPRQTRRGTARGRADHSARPRADRRRGPRVERNGRGRPGEDPAGPRRGRPRPGCHRPDRHVRRHPVEPRPRLPQKGRIEIVTGVNLPMVMKVPSALASARGKDARSRDGPDRSSRRGAARSSRPGAMETEKRTA